MSKFVIGQATVVKFTCEDGKQFDSAAEAEAHQFGLENAEKLSLATESYLNKFGYKNRSRKQKESIAREFYSFFLAWDGEVIARTVMDDEEVAPAVKATDVISADDVEAAEVEVEGTVEAEVKADAPVVETEEEDDLF